MDIKIVNEKGEVEQTKPQEQKESETVPVPKEELEINSVGSLFDLKPSEIGEYADQIGTLLEYAKSMTDDHSREGLLWAIRELQYKVGTPPLGEKMITYLTKYAYLKLEDKKIEEEIKKYERDVENV